MEIAKISLAINLLIALAIFHTSNAQKSPHHCLIAHNSARAKVGVGPMTWDNQVAAYAKRYANKLKDDCKLVHSHGPYGENLAGSTGDLSGPEAVKMWVDEKPHYDYKSNSCVGGECRHYTQVVWRNSVRLGCAKVRCTNGGTVFACSYDPPGNRKNKRPY